MKARYFLITTAALAIARSFAYNFGFRTKQWTIYHICDNFLEWAIIATAIVTIWKIYKIAKDRKNKEQDQEP